MKSFLISLLKWGLMVLIFAFLFGRAAANRSLRGFLDVQKEWQFLFGGFTAVLTAVMITFLRWKRLNNALGIPQTAGNAIRLGFIGYLFNFLPMGIVGGDVIKGVMLSHRCPQAKVACAAGIIMDRVIGLYVMFLLGLAAAGVTGFWRSGQPQAHSAFHVLLWLTAVLTIGLAVVLFPCSGKERRRRLFEKAPCVGRFLVSLYDAVARYRGKPSVLFCAALATLAVHLLLAAGIYFTARGLWNSVPSAANHLVIYPIANIGSMIPLSAGPFEFFLDQLYPLFPLGDGTVCSLGTGLLVGVAYRFITLVIAAIGGIYFLAARGEIGQALNENAPSQTEGGT